MKFLHEYRDRDLAWTVAETIEKEAERTRNYHFMLFSSGLSRSVLRHGVTELLPENIRLLHGPGCMGCTLPATRIDQALQLTERPDSILCVFPGMLAALGSDGRSLAAARTAGADIRAVRSARAAVDIAQRTPWRRVVLFATGLEAAAPGTALALRHARLLGMRNFFVLNNHLLTPPAISDLLAGNPSIDGVLAPGEVASVIGTAPFATLARKHRRPIAISGNEPLDVLQSILLLLRRVARGKAGMDNQFARAATVIGNPTACALLAETFAVREHFRWYGLGDIPDSALSLAPEFASYDAETVFGLVPSDNPEVYTCPSREILRGLRPASACPLLGQHCTPREPHGPCMTSQEAPCGAHWQDLHLPLRLSTPVHQDNATPRLPISAGDVVIVSGTVGDHGVAMLATLDGVGFDTDVETDLAPMQALRQVVQQVCPQAHLLQNWMHEGVAAELNAAAAESGLGMIINEQAVPRDEQVEAACELLDIDPLHLANAGKLIAIVRAKDAPAALSAMRATRAGVRATAIGRVVEDPLSRVLLQGDFGGSRVLAAQPELMAAMGA